ncbi:PAS domain-containing protein (plasmid) [Phormidium sp. CLA17]|uniref:GAF domain-containing sensor histidine kinase n=1 Tax=Leptolyngbya sp. Cla-17 TaxID=2803751 RepID=UPI0014911244|nr:GAF domain-containing sensor histidine kinase [Leptolyngbya sp. Cla-17]MBM0744862.1 PAS domain-containing protein [Leptolyngbya sp. Cla-17]
MTATSKHPQQTVLEVLSSLSYRTGELSSYLQEVAQGLSELMELDWSVVTFCKDDSERILASTINLGESADEIYSLHGSLTGTVVKTGEPLVVEDATACTNYGNAPEGYRAYLGVPLRTPAGEVIGTICSFQHQPRYFTESEVQLAKLFAERAATAIDNYHLYQQQQQVNKQLEAEIKDRRQAQIALQESEEKFRQLAENIEQVFWIRRPDGQILYLSPAFEQVWGQSCQQWLHDRSLWAASIHPDDRTRVLEAQKLGQEKVDEEYRIIRADGSTRLIRDQSFPVRDDSGHVYRIAGIAEDITERRQAEQEMGKAIAALAEVGELAAMIVHEVRNPLTTVLMGLDAIKSMELPESVQERLNLSLEEADRIRNLLKEILLYAKPQVLQPSKLEINAFISDTLESIRMMPAISRKIDFVPAPYPIKVLADKDKLKQVFINLVDNACQALPIESANADARITWTVESDLTTNSVYIRIHNGGNPIPPETLPKIMKPFFTTKSCGTGLGLAIVKRIIDAHSGELMITSNAAEGTQVSIKFAIA